MNQEAADFWTDETSVLFTSFWGWAPETWGTVGWTGDNGFTRRANLLKRLSDPFITVCYVTSNKSYADPALKGMIAGFYLISHQMGDRDAFTHPCQHDRDPDKWRHSLKAIRAFSYLPECRKSARDLEPELTAQARSISSMGKILTSREQIEFLRSIPCSEVGVYVPPADRASAGMPEKDAGAGMVKAGPAGSGGYDVDNDPASLPRELYVLRLGGDTDVYLGKDSGGRSIFKIGISVSPDLRRQHFQKTIPRGRFNWVLHRTSRKHGSGVTYPFSAAVAGEYVMKRHLLKNGDWLGGEFYLASESELEHAWRLAHETAEQVKE